VNTRNLPFGMAKSFKLPPPAWTKGIYFDKRTKAPHHAFCTLGCGVLFGLGSFPFSFLVPLPGVFLLLIYWWHISLHTTQGHHTLHDMFPWNGPFPCLAHLWIHCLSLLLLALAMPMPLGLTHCDHGKQACHHKKVADRQIFHYLLCKASHIFTKRRQTKGIVHAPTIRLGK